MSLEESNRRINRLIAMHKKLSEANMASVGVPTRGPGSQRVNAVCFLVPDDDARVNTVTHGLS